MSSVGWIIPEKCNNHHSSTQSSHRLCNRNQLSKRAFLFVTHPTTSLRITRFRFLSKFTFIRWISNNTNRHLYVNSSWHKIRWMRRMGVNLTKSNYLFRVDFISLESQRTTTACQWVCSSLSLSLTLTSRIYIVGAEWYASAQRHIHSMCLCRGCRCGGEQTHYKWLYSISNSQTHNLIMFASNRNSLHYIVIYRWFPHKHANDNRRSLAKRLAQPFAIPMKMYCRESNRVTGVTFSACFTAHNA